MIEPKAIEEASKLLHVSERVLTDAKLDITPVQYSVLAIVAEQGRAKPADLARRMEVAPTVVTGIVDRLERKGLVVREHDATDRRVTFAVVTDAGADVYLSATEALERHAA